MPMHALDLVTVLETGDWFALRLARSSLDDAGIAYLVTGDDPRYIAGFAGAFGAAATPIVKWSCRIQVGRESETEARALLEPIQNPSEVPDVDGE